VIVLEMELVKLYLLGESLEVWLGLVEYRLRPVPPVLVLELVEVVTQVPPAQACRLPLNL
jgi:hypothetical protein